ncbi:MAG: PAS domain S-box protein [Acidimicrobiales bacterium]|nr:PAS domain S-box protein [Acidimicrobiales bacterium]
MAEQHEDRAREATFAENMECRGVEHELAVSRRQLEEAQRIAHIGSSSFDVRTGEMRWSPECYRILGIDPSVAPTIESWTVAVHPDDRQEVVHARTNVAERGVPFEMTHRVVRPDGVVRWVRTRAVAELSSEGVVVGVIGTMLDDTERLAAEASARQAESLFEIGFEHSAVAAVLSDLGGHPYRVNPAMCRLLGRPAEMLTGRRWTDYSHPDEAPLGKVFWRGVKAGRDSHHEERRYLRPDGTTVWVMAHVSLVRDDAGAPLYCLGEFQDLTERKLSEAGLRESEERLALALAHAPIGTALRSLDGRWIRANAVLCAMLGRTEAELQSLSSDDVVHPDDRDAQREVVRRLLAGEDKVVEIEKRYVHADGHPIEVLASLAVTHDAAGRAVDLIVQVQDIGERKRLERERDASLEDLRRSNAELEQFAYAASHDLSEPLRAIAGPISLLARRYRGRLDADADQYIDFAIDGCKRMQILIDDLLAYSRVGRLEAPRSLVDCNLVMTSSLHSLRDQLDTSGGAVDVDPLPTVWGDSTQLGQVFQNVVSNGLKFVAAGRVPHVRVAAANEDGMWRFTVSDNGIGIEPRYRAQVFDMFTRLHGRDEFPGTGIGLALVRKIVEGHGGEVGIGDPPPEGGTTLWFTIPAGIQSGAQ